MKSFQLKVFITIFLLLFIRGFTYSQTNCFVQLSDATGIEYTQDQIDSLEAAACDLIQTLPAQFQSDFKVYDFGFYRHNAEMEGGVKVVWHRKLEEIKFADSSFFMVGRVLDDQKEILLKLAFNGLSSCFSSNKIEGFKEEIERFVLNNDMDFYSLNLKIMSKIKKLIINSLECCYYSGKHDFLNSRLNIDTSLLSIDVCIDNSCDNNPPQSVAIISSEPRMPQVSFKLDYPYDFSCQKLKAELRVSYMRETDGAPSRSRMDSVQIYIDSVEIGFNYMFDIQNSFQGGRAKIIISDQFNMVLQDYSFTIKGQNPTAKNVYDYIDNMNYSENFWFLKHIATHENGADPEYLHNHLYQFNPMNIDYENLEEDWDAFSRCPNLSSNEDGGWGLTQLTNPVPPKDALWNWKKNIDLAYNLLNEDKVNLVEIKLNNWVPEIVDWNTDNPMDTVSYHSDYEDGGITYVHAINEYFKGNSLIESHFKDDLREGEKSFLDAMIIKTFNGIGAGSDDRHYYYLSTEEGGDKPLWKVDNTAHYGGGLNRYVRSISNTIIPQY